MLTNETLIVDDSWRSGTLAPGELPMLSDFGADFWEFLGNDRCVGTQTVIMAALAVLGKLTGRQLDAQVRPPRPTRCTRCRLTRVVLRRSSQRQRRPACQL